jgi:hypothetical protein
MQSSRRRSKSSIGENRHRSKQTSASYQSVGARPGPPTTLMPASCNTQTHTTCQHSGTGGLVCLPRQSAGMLLDYEQRNKAVNTWRRCTNGHASAHKECAVSTLKAARCNIHTPATQDGTGSEASAGQAQRRASESDRGMAWSAGTKTTVCSTHHYTTWCVFRAKGSAAKQPRHGMVRA